MTKKLETKNSLIWGKRGGFYFSPILMTLKKSFASLRFFRQCFSQAAIEYFVILAALLAVTLLSLSFFYPKVKDVSEDFYNVTAMAMLGEAAPPAPRDMVKVSIGHTNRRRPPDTAQLCGGLAAYDFKTIEIYKDTLFPADPCRESPGNLPNLKCLESFGGNQAEPTTIAASWTQNKWNYTWGLTFDPTYCHGGTCCINKVTWAVGTWTNWWDIIDSSKNPAGYRQFFIDLTPIYTW